MELFLLVCCMLMTQTVATMDQLQATISELNRGIGTSTNLYYSYSRGPLYEIALREATVFPPRVLLNELATYEWGHYFDGEVLAIVFLERRISAQQQQSLRKSMRNRGGTHMLLVLEAQSIASDAAVGSELSVASVEQEWLELFRWCWRSGFYNVLLLDAATGELVTYTPFPELQLRQTTVAQYLQQPHKWRDFQGYTVRVAASNLPPASYNCPSKSTGDTIIGALPNALQYFVKSRNATLQVVTLSHYGSKPNCLLCASLLHEGEADVCDCMVPRQSNATLRYTTSASLQIINSYLMVPYARPLRKYSYFGAPFTRSLWLLLGFTVVHSGLAVALICRHQSGEWRVGHSLLEAFRAMLLLGFRLPLRSGKLGGYLQWMLFLSGFVIANLYLALLSSILTTDIYGPQINSFHDLLANNISILYDMNYHGIYAERYIPHVVWQQMRPVPLQVLERWRNELSPEYAYLGVKYMSTLFLHQQKYLLRPRMKFLDQSLFGELSGMPMFESLPFAQLINEHMRHLFEGGILDELRARTVQDAIHCGITQFFPTEYYTVEPLSPEFFIMPAMVLAFGYAAAAISFIVERVLHSFYGRRPIA